MSAKQIVFRQSARERMLAGVNTHSGWWAPEELTHHRASRRHR